MSVSIKVVEVVVASEAELCRWCLRRATLFSLNERASGAGERFGFRVSTKDEEISQTNAAHRDWRRCLPRTEAFE